MTLAAGQIVRNHGEVSMNLTDGPVMLGVGWKM